MHNQLQDMDQKIVKVYREYKFYKYGIQIHN